MNKIMELVTENSTYLLLTLGAILIGVVLTFIVNFAARDLKFIKYLPGLALVFIGIISLFMVINKLFDPDSLDNLIIFVIGLSSGLVSLIFALIIGIIYGFFVFLYMILSKIGLTNKNTIIGYNQIPPILSPSVLYQVNAPVTKNGIY